MGSERMDKLMTDVDALLADPTGAERLANHGASLVRRINLAFDDAKLPFVAELSVETRAIRIREIPLHEADRVTCRIEDISRVIESRERGAPSWP